MEVEVIPDAKDRGVGERGFVDIEECIVDGNEWEDEEVDLPNEFALFFGVDGLPRFVYILE